MAIVNQAFAKHFFAGRNPLGRRMTQGSGDVKLDTEIVGVVRNTKHDSVRETTARFFYLPYLQIRAGRMTFLVRPAATMPRFPNQVRRIVRETDPNIRSQTCSSMEAQVERTLSVDRLTAWLAGGFGVLAMLLAVGRTLRRDRLHGGAPDGRDRRPHGARRDARQHRRAGAARSGDAAGGRLGGRYPVRAGRRAATSNRNCSASRRAIR